MSRIGRQAFDQSRTDRRRAEVAVELAKHGERLKDALENPPQSDKMLPDRFEYTLERIEHAEPWIDIGGMG